MIMIWNRKEVFTGYSIQKFDQARATLAANKIKYTYRVVNRDSAYLFGSRRARTGTFGENMEYSNTYYVYVHKSDYDNACAVLKSI